MQNIIFTYPGDLKGTTSDRATFFNTSVFSFRDLGAARKLLLKFTIYYLSAVQELEYLIRYSKIHMSYFTNKRAHNYFNNIEQLRLVFQFNIFILCYIRIFCFQVATFLKNALISLQLMLRFHRNY